MAIKVGKLMIGETPNEQYKLERRRFLARQRPKKVLAEELEEKARKAAKGEFGKKIEHNRLDYD